VGQVQLGCIICKVSALHLVMSHFGVSSGIACDKFSHVCEGRGRGESVVVLSVSCRDQELGLGQFWCSSLDILASPWFYLDAMWHLNCPE